MSTEQVPEEPELVPVEPPPPAEPAPPDGWGWVWGLALGVALLVTVVVGFLPRAPSEPQGDASADEDASSEGAPRKGRRAATVEEDPRKARREAAKAEAAKAEGADGEATKAKAAEPTRTEVEDDEPVEAAGGGGWSVKPANGAEVKTTAKGASFTWKAGAAVTACQRVEGAGTGKTLTGKWKGTEAAKGAQLIIVDRPEGGAVQRRPLDRLRKVDDWQRLNVTLPTLSDKGRIDLCLRLGDKGGTLELDSVQVQ